MTDKDNYPGVYVEETESARQIDGVATTGTAGQSDDEESPGTSIPGVPTSSRPESPKTQPVEQALADERAGAPVHLSDEAPG